MTNYVITPEKWPDNALRVVRSLRITPEKKAQLRITPEKTAQLRITPDYNPPPLLWG